MWCRFTVWSFRSLSQAHVCSIIAICLVTLTDFRVIVGSSMSLASSFIDLGAGLSVGLAGLAAGFAIGIVGDAGVRGTAQQPRLFVGMVGSLCMSIFPLC